MIVSCLLLPTAARAGNDDELFVGNQAAMVGGAVISTVNDASSTWYNPAGLGGVDRDQFDLSATVYTLRSYSAPKLISTPSGAYVDGSVTELVVAPAQIAYVRRLSAGTALGFGYFVPKASNFVLRANLTDHDGDPQSQWQLAAAGAQTQHIGAIAIGHAVNPKLRLGASLIGGYAATTASASLFGSVSPGGETRGSSAINTVDVTSRFSLQLALGAQWQLTEAVTIGATLRTPDMQLHSRDDNNFNISVTSLVDPGQPRFGAMAREEVESIGVELQKAGRGALSFNYSYGAGRITAEADLQPGLHRPRLGVDRKAVWNARLGWYHSLSSALAFGVGAFTDRRPDAQPYRLIDGTGDCYGGTAGVELNNEHLLAPTERASSLVFKSVFALRYAHCGGDFGRIAGNPDGIADDPFQTQKGSIVIHELSLYVGGGLGF